MGLRFMQEKIDLLLSELSLIADLSDKSATCVKLAEIYRSTKNHNKAREYSLMAIDFAQKSENYKSLVNSYSSLAISSSIEGNNLFAKENLIRALDYAKKIEDQSIISSVLINLATVVGLMSNFSESLEYFLEALKLVEKLNDISKVATLYGNIGIIYRRIGNYPQALAFSKKAFKIRAEQKLNEDIANSCINIGNLYKLMNDMHLAMGYYKKAQKILDIIENKNKQAMLFYNMADIYFHRNDLIQSINCYQKSLQISREYNEKGSIILALQQLGKIYTNSGDIDAAIQCFTEAEELSEKIDDNDILNSLYSFLAEFYTKIQSYQKANFFLNRMLKFNQQNYSEKMSKEVAKLTSQFEMVQKQQENELYRLKNVELVKSNALIEKQKKELENLNQSKDSILRVVSHDLKNILGGLYSIIDLVKNEELNERVNKYIHHMENSCEKGLRLVQMLLESHQIEMEDFKLDLMPQSISMVLNYMLNPYLSLKNSKNININFQNLLQNEAKVFMNPDKFNQILDNLINNAIKFSRNDSQVDITLDQTVLNENLYIRLSIKDYGIGIAQENLQLIFNKFTKARRKGTSGENTTGLGLSIVKRLIELHHGEIIVKSKENEGSEFSIYLPIVVE